MLVGIFSLVIDIWPGTAGYVSDADSYLLDN